MLYIFGMLNFKKTPRQGSNGETSCLTYSVREADHILKVSESTIRRMIRAGQIRVVRFRGVIRIPKSAIEDFLRGIVGKEAA
ncbi:MAG: helix-turn-helix domain-containing protein [Planctomycetes bacterium]|nr:helix-turn-helix domain-containing protein [Planctomycetota bacterium]